MNQAFDARLEFDERAIVGDVGHAAMEARLDRIFRLDALPRIFEQLLHAERNAVRFVVDLDDLDADRLADREHFARMIDAAPGDVGDMQQAVDTAEIDEGAVIGDVLHHAVDHLALFEVGDDLMALLGAGFFQDGAARDDNIAAAAIHLEDLEGLRNLHKRRHVADRADIDLAARQKGHGAVEIDSEAALDLIEDHAFDAFLLLESLFELDPALLAPSLVARDDGFAEGVFDAFEIDLDFIADTEGALAPRSLKSLRGTRPSVFNPTSITATSFSMATTIPLMTEPSKASFSP